MVTELWGLQEFWKKINERGITWKLYTREQSLLRATHCLYQIQIPIEFHEDISKRVTELWRVYKNENYKGSTL